MERQVFLSFDDNRLLPVLTGAHGSHLKRVEAHFGISIVTRGNELSLSGPEDAVTQAETLIRHLWEKTTSDRDLTLQDVDAALRFLEDRRTDSGDRETIVGERKTDLRGFSEDLPVIRAHGKVISPRSPNQSSYIESMRTHDLVFGLGPGGTGKTFLAVAQGVSLYLEGEVSRLIFCRPAVEAGERLGFLPGDLMEKIDPYLRPIYDALHEILPADRIARKIAAGDIEIAPLAFMRGRTLKNAFVLLDEAQNTTPMQMKMFLTRMGEGTRMVITGDVSQIDLPPGTDSGLEQATAILEGLPEIGFARFSASDVVRHRLVSRIIDAYDASGGSRASR